MIRRDARPLQLAEGVLRITLPLPFALDHVHCYLLRSEDGGWTLVDTGLRAPDPEAQWDEALGALDGPVERIVVTHFHPDHVGGSADVAEITGAPVHEGALDYESCVRAWDDEGAAARVSEHLLRHGVPESEVADIGRNHAGVVGVIRFERDPVRLDPGDRVDGWELVHLPGHADGHLCLLRDGVLVAGDALLGSITPNIGLYPGGRPDPLADYLDSLERMIALAPDVAYPGHGEPIRAPAARAAAIRDHHAERLRQAVDSLGGEPRSAYEVAQDLFPDAQGPALRRFAFAETIAHLEHLAFAGAVERIDEGGRTLYAARAAGAS